MYIKHIKTLLVFLLLKESLCHLTLCLIDFPEHSKFFNYDDVEHRKSFSAQYSVSLLLRSDQKQHLEKILQSTQTTLIIITTPINVYFIVYYQIPVEFIKCKLK